MIQFSFWGDHKGLDSTQYNWIIGTKREATAMETSDFYVEQTQCAMCDEPTTRIGLPVVDVMRGKEPVVCGFCLVQMPKFAAEQSHLELG